MLRKTSILLTTLLLFSVQMFAQCPMCKASVESSQSSGTKSVGMGLNAGILILLVSVYVLVFAVGIIWYKKFRRAQITDNAF